MKTTCIIPSKNPDNLRVCLSALRLQDPAVAVVVVDDSDGANREVCEAYNVKRVLGAKPFVWARNINIGIRAAGDVDGVVLLNDDAILETSDGFSKMAREVSNYRLLHHGLGVTSAAVRGMAAANDQSHVGAAGLREATHHMVAFIAVYIPADALKAVGELDERFTEYGYDDDDYCQRVKAAGYQLGVFHGCIVEHGSRPSTFRSRPGTSLEPNRRKFIEKWGYPPGKVPAGHLPVGANSAR